MAPRGLEKDGGAGGAVLMMVGTVHGVLEGVCESFCCMVREREGGADPRSGGM